MSTSLPLDDRAVWRSFRHHSRTFSLAAHLLARPVRQPVATLYLFCRSIDTIADERVREVGASAALGELDGARRALVASLEGRPPADPLWTRLADVHAAYDLAPAPLFELLDGAEWDLRGRPVRDLGDLLAYSNLVGGSVGAMMLPFLVSDRSRHAGLETPARSLGTAMQITNICRDVGEDRRLLGRTYLPLSWLSEAGLAPCALDGPVPDGYANLVERAMEHAETLYRESRPGIDALPGRARAGIRAAARMYREIMNEVRARGYDNLSQRAYVPLSRKLRLVLHDDYDRRKEALLSRRMHVTS